MRPFPSNHEGTRANEFSMLRSMKVGSWHPGIKTSKLTRFLAATNSGVADDKRTSGQVADASDYIRFKKIGAVTKEFSKK